jgi:hypothetical protein
LRKIENPKNDSPYSITGNMADTVLLPPLSEPFTDDQLHEYLSKLVNTIKESNSASVEEAYAKLHLPSYLTINARASDSGSFVS